MNHDDEQIKKRFLELAERAAKRGVCTHTGFLGMHELALLSSLRKAVEPYTLYGGAEGCERQMARFGAETHGAQPLPIACIRIAPAGARFAQALAHRDVLGALMSLGVERDTLGDIFIEYNTAYVFCTKAIAPFIAENLAEIGRSPVRCAPCDAPAALTAPRLVCETVQAASERIDGIVARVWKLPREESKTLFAQGRVFLNGAACTRSDMPLQADDTVSVRGYGRFVYRGVRGTSRKGKLHIEIEKY